MNHLRIYDDLQPGDFVAIQWLLPTQPVKRMQIIRGYFVGWLKLTSGKRAIEITARNIAYSGSWIVITKHIVGMRRANPRSAER